MLFYYFDYVKTTYEESTNAAKVYMSHGMG